LFILNDGTPVFGGDTVKFYTDGSPFPTSGLVQNINGLQLACFSPLLNKWRYWDIKNDLVEV
jgi:hypothetical protein